MTCLQIFFKQRMKKHKYDVLIKNFCRQMKHCLFKTRKRRHRKTKKRHLREKSNVTQMMHIKLFANKKKSRFLEQSFH
jgi:hypothetical protein